jgi:hypothetical protein
MLAASDIRMSYPFIQDLYVQSVCWSIMCTRPLICTLSEEPLVAQLGQITYSLLRWICCPNMFLCACICNMFMHIYIYIGHIRKKFKFCETWIWRWTVRVCIQKFPDWPPGARTASGTALCHEVQLYRYFVSQSSEFCCHNPLCCFWTSVYCCKLILRYRLSQETSVYTLVYVSSLSYHASRCRYHVCVCVSTVILYLNSLFMYSCGIAANLQLTCHLLLSRQTVENIMTVVHAVPPNTWYV